MCSDPRLIRMAERLVFHKRCRERGNCVVGPPLGAASRASTTNTADVAAEIDDRWGELGPVQQGEERKTEDTREGLNEPIGVE